MIDAAINPFTYSTPIWQHFTQPQRAGQFPSATPGVIEAEAGTPAAYSVLRLQFRIDAGRVADARFKAYGCPASIAVGDWIAQWSIGKTAAELAGVDARQLREVLEIPSDRAHCALLGEDALRALLNQWITQA